jgi:hypothetical protein
LNAEAETITKKINEMSAEFNLAAQKMTGSGAAEVGVTMPPFFEDNVTESTTEGGKDTTSDQKKQPKTSRRRGFGGELTLDD